MDKPNWWKKSLPSINKRNPDLVKSICIAPKNKFAVIIEQSKRVLVLDPPSLWTRRIISLSRCSAIEVACLKDGKHVLVGCGTNQVVLFSVTPKFRLKEIRRTEAPNCAISKLAPIKGQGKVVIATKCGSLWVWNYQKGTAPRKIREIYPLKVRFSKVWALAVRPQGDFFVAGTRPDGVVFFDVKTGKKLLQIHDKSWDGPYSAAFSPDGKLLAVGYGDSKIRIWKIESH